MNGWFVLLLFLHIVAAIVAYGPTFAFPLIAAAGRKHPQHAAFAAEVNLLIGSRLVLPMALSMAVSGVLLIIVGGIDLFQPWLIVSIIVYIISIGYLLLIQSPAMRELAQLLNGMAGPGAQSAGGPPPRLHELGAQMQRGGMILGSCCW